MMSTFRLEERDILIISLSANILFVLQLLLGRCVAFVLKVCKNHSSKANRLGELDQARPSLFGRILMEQTSLWVLSVMVIASLNFTSLTIMPFRHQPKPEPEFLIRLTLCGNTARSLVIAVRLALVKDVIFGNTPRTVASHDQTKHVGLDLLYALFNAVSCLLCLGFKENLFLGMAALLMELGSTPLQCTRLIRLVKEPDHVGSNSYRKTAIICFVTCVVCRLCLPLFVATLSLKRESPFVMGTVLIVWFFISIFFYIVFNSILLYQSFKRLWTSVKQTIPSNNPYPCLERPHISIYDYPDMLSNDIRDNAERKDENHQKRIVPFYKNCDYIFLRPYDNRNVTPVICKEDHEKSNTFKRKDTSKHTIIFKSLQQNTVSVETLLTSSQRQNTISTSQPEKYETITSMDLSVSDMTHGQSPSQVSDVLHSIDEENKTIDIQFV